ncbi:MAG TPA: phage portal protein [Ktedonobacterales bacterium]|nr:phage portal protein [Ktedonobacterales bacterium]
MSASSSNDDHIALDADAQEQQHMAPKLDHLRSPVIQSRLPGFDLPTPPSPTTHAGSAPMTTTQQPAAQRTRPAHPLTQPVAFPPGEPLHPTPGLEGPHGDPRQWSYPVGFNIGQRPRGTEATSFEQLRSLAALYDGIQLCERVYFDILARLEPRAVPRSGALEPGDTADSRSWRAAGSRIEAFLESPDRITDLRSWLTAFVRDLLEIDAVAIYTRQTCGGRLHALELVAGETIKPLLDSGGRAPQPPHPAYQQFLYGVPAGLYTAADLDYIRETARTDSPYGLSRVERVILRVNQALRKQDFDLARFTDGATPLGIIQSPATLAWTPEQLDTFERAFNGLLAGNDRIRVRAKTLPPGATWYATTGDDPLVEFDRFLLNVTVAAFGLTMDELGFTADSNRSVGQTQENVIYRRAVAPVIALAAGFLTRKVRRWLDPRFTITFAGIEEPEDFATRAEAFARLIPLGVVTPFQAAQILHLPIPPDSSTSS